MKIAASVLSLSFLLAGVCFSAERQPVSEKDRINYSVGYQIGGDFKKQEIELDPGMLVQGIQDAMDSASPRMNPQEMRKTLVALKVKLTAEERKRKSGKIPPASAEARAYLDNNAKQEGVVTLPSGVQYKVFQEGAGRTPTADDNVTVNYRGTLPDGNEFYDSRRTGGPSSNKVGTLIPGLRESLTHMKEGGRLRAFIPPELGYDENSPLAGKILIFDIELLKVQSTN